MKKIKLSQAVYRFLATLCQDNFENSDLIYNLSPNFQSHVLYIPECVHTLRKIFKNNEEILHKLGHNQINFNVLGELEKDKEAPASILNIVINIVDSSSQNKGDNGMINFSRQNKLSTKSINLIQYFVKLLWQGDHQTKITNLKFLNTICRFGNEGISIIQEKIYKLYFAYCRLIDATDPLLNLRIEEDENKMQFIIDFSKSPTDKIKKKIILEENLKNERIIEYDENLDENLIKLTPEILDFLIAQLNLYSAVSFDRNYLWKKEITTDNNFPKQYLLLNMWNKNMPLKLRACFAKLAISLYLNEQPFNPITLPQMCRIFNAKDHSSKPNSVLKTLGTIKSTLEKEKDLFINLIEESLALFKQITQKINSQTFKNPLFYYVLEIFYLLIRTNAFQHLGLEEEYHSLMKYLVYIVNYDEKKSLKKNKKKEDKHQSLNPEENSNKLSANLMLNSPILSGLNTIMNILTSLEKENTVSSKREQNAKLLICDIFEYLIFKRQDTLIDKMLLWFNDIQNNGHTTKISIEKEIKEEIQSMIPEIFQSGIQEIDERFAFQKDSENILNILGKKIQKNPEFYNLNELFSKNKKDSILPSLFNLFLTSNNKMVETKSIKLITKLYNQYEDLVKHVNSLEIIFDDLESKIYLFLHDLIDSTKYLIEKCEIWLSKYINDNEDKNIVEIMIFILKNINNYFFYGCELAQTEDKETFLEFPLGMPINGDKIFKERQNIFRYLDGHLILLDFLEDGAHYFEEMILEMDSEKIMSRKILIDLFTQLFLCLKNYCVNNSENQQSLYEHIGTILEYAQYDLGQINLLCTIFENNHKLLERVDEKLIEKMLSLIENEGRQAKFLDFFIVIQKYKQEFMVENQLLILKKILPDRIDHKLRLFLFADISSKKQITFYFDRNMPASDQPFLEKMLENNFENTFRDESFLYHNKLFKVLILLCKGNDVSNLATTKLKKIFKLHYFLELLLEPDSFGKFSEEFENSTDKPQKQEVINIGGITLLKPRLINLIIEIYFKNPIKMTIYDSNSKKIEFFIEKEIKRFENVNFKQIDSFGMYFHYFFKNFLKFVVYYYESLENKYYFEGENSDEQSIFKYLALIIHNNKGFLKNKLSEKQMIHLKKLMVIAKIDTENDEKYYMSNVFHLKSSGEILDFQKETDEFEVTVKEVEREKDEGNEEMIGSRVKMLGTIKRSKGVIQAGKVYQKDKIWKIFQKEFVGSEILAKEMENEKKALGLTFLFLQDYKVKNKRNPIFSQKNIIKKIISFIQEGYTNPDNQATIIILLQVLKSILDESKNNFEKMQKMQNLFNDLDATTMVLTILSDEMKYLNPEFLSKILSFMISLLKKGNSLVQSTFYEYCITYSKSELVFQKFFKIIRNQIDFIEKNSDLRNDNLENFNYTSFVKKHILSKILEKNDKVLVKVLKLLQLLTEGHNLPMQTYLSKQENNRNSYDLVNALVDLLTTYYCHTLCQGMYKQINNCLNTLIEFVQGPCPKNQIVVSESRFFDIVKNFFREKPILKRVALVKGSEEKLIPSSLSMNSPSDSPLIQPLSSSKRKKNKKNAYLETVETQEDKDAKSLNQFQIVRLQHKFMVLIMALLEMRDLKDSEIIMKRIVRALPKELLEQKITHIYLQYKSIYNKKYIIQAFGHNKDKKKEKTNIAMKSLKMIMGGNSSKRDLKEKEFILETGFQLFFLFCNYCELEDLGKKNEIDVLNSKKLKANYNILGKNIVGQLVNFLTLVVLSILSYVRSVQKQIKTTLDKEDSFSVLDPKKYDKHKKKALNFFFQNSSHIEITRNNKLERIRFYLLPICHCLPKERKDEFNQTVNRETTNSKVFDLVSETKKLIKVCENEEKLKIYFSQNKLVALFANYVGLWKEIAFFLSLLLNIFIIASFSNYYGDRMTETHLFLSPNISHETTRTVFTFCGWMMTGCSVFVVAFFIVKNAPLIFQKAWDEKEKKNNDKKIKGFQKFSTFVRKCIKSIYLLLHEIEVIYYLAYAALTVLGTTVHPFFFAFHLTEILMRYPLLKNVILSFWHPRKLLVLTLILFILLVYICSLFGYSFFYSFYNGTCENTLVCFLITFDQTFKNNGGIGGYFSSNEPQTNTNFSVGRFFFDNIANIVIVIIMINIFAGIIIDTFGSLRESENEKNKDIKDKCFICGLNKQIFDRKSNSKSGGYLHHIKIDHYMWNYVFYIAYLWNQEENDDNGVESYIRGKLKPNIIDLSWFPFGRALEIQDEQNDEENEKKTIESIKRNVQEMMENIRNINNKNCEK